jgi:glycosyltransferase involved in cell wall biosynthesis
MRTDASDTSMESSTDRPGAIRSTWIVMAAFNEAAVIEQVLAELRGAFPNIVVVDDASNDDTLRCASRMDVTVLRHPINLGQGAALQTGISYALKQGAEIIVTFDADGQHRVEDASLLVAAVAQGGCDVALGSRFLGQAVDMPTLRRVVLKAAVLFQALTSGLRLTDAHNGLRALNRRAAASLSLTENRMAHASQLIEQLARARMRLAEYPVTIRYTAYSLAKGQRLSNAVSIALKVLVGKITQ